MCLPKTQRQQGPSFEKRNVWYLSVTRFSSLFLRLLWGVHLLGSKKYLFPIPHAIRPGYLLILTLLPDTFVFQLLL